MAPIVELDAIRRKQILAAAQLTIAAAGHANVTMADICKAAGLSKGGLAHYYQSKEDLFQAVFHQFFDGIFQRAEATFRTAEGPLERLLSFRWLYSREDPDLDTGYPILFDFMSIAAHDPAYRTIFHAWIDNWIRLLREALEDGRTTGLFTGALDAEAMARTISAVYQGIATRWYLAPGDHSTRWAVEALQAAVGGLLAPYLTGSEPPDAR
jgi:AcrR family transcriptional regulator